MQDVRQQLLDWRYLTREQIDGFDNYKVNARGGRGITTSIMMAIAFLLLMDTVQRHRHIAAEPICNASLLGLACQGE